MTEDALHSSIVDRLGNLHPQIAAVILFSLPPDTAGAILSDLPLYNAFEVSERIIETEEINIPAITRISEWFKNLYPDFNRLDTDKKPLLSAVLEHTGYIRRREIILHFAENLSIQLPHSKLRIMDDIADVENPELDRIIASIDTGEITAALRIAPDGLKKKILGCFPEETAAEIRSDLDWSGAVLLDRIGETCQGIITHINDKLYKDIQSGPF